MVRRILPLSIVAPLLLAAATAARAQDDSVLIDELPYSGTVVGLRDGRLLLTLPRENRLVDLAQVKRITLVDYPKFNQAEAVRGSDPRAAIAFYKDAIRAINHPALKQLAELRAIEPADADGKWTDAVAWFLDVYQASPIDTVWQQRPRHLPGAGSSMLKESADALAAAVKRAPSEEARKNLRLLELDVLTRAGETAAAERVARALSTGVAEDDDAPAKPAEAASPASGAVAAVEAALQAKNYDAALRQADTALKAGAAGDVAIQLFALQARAYAEQNQPDLAAATLLRIPAHYASSPAVPTALLQAAQLESRAGHTADARALYKELIDRYPDAKETVIARGAMK